MKWIKTLCICIIPSLIFFDMIDPILMIIIGVFYGLSIILEALACIILGSAYFSKDRLFKQITHDRMVGEIEQDTSFFTRSIIETLLHSFALVMIYPLSIVVSVIMFSYIVLFVMNLIFCKKSIDYGIGSGEL